MPSIKGMNQWLREIISGSEKIISGLGKIIRGSGKIISGPGKKLYGSTPAERNILEVVQNHFWSQYIDFPTHVGGAVKAGGEMGRDGNILDLALCNS